MATVFLRLQEKALCPFIFFARYFGAGNGCATLMDAWKNAFFLQENLHAHKIPRFRGGGILGFLGGECRFHFYGRWDFSERKQAKKQ